MPASDYSTVVILIAAAVAIALGILVLSHLIGPRRPGPVKDDTYESGMDPFTDARRRFQVRFYLIAVLFLIFDAELIFFYPWAVLLPRLRAAAGTPEQESVQALLAAGYGPGYLLAAMGVFFGLLLLGLVYEWRRGVFRWN